MAGPQPRAAVLAPSPWLETLIEGPAGRPEIHLHAAGQGFWIGRLLSALGLEVTMCATFGGEIGMLIRALCEQLPIEVRGVTTAGSSGCYVHDRRGTERVELASVRPPPLTRHEIDDLYGMVLVAGLDADVVVLGGPGEQEDVIGPDVYARLAADLRANGRRVVADLAGGHLEAALQGGVSVVKVSADELEATGAVVDKSPAALQRALRDLCSRGADHAVVSRAEAGALALVDGKLWEVHAPRLRIVEARGAGDSLTAGLAAGLAFHGKVDDALRLGVVAGALNVTRRGLASGTREEIERLCSHIELRRMEQLNSN
ncbi:MAG TPA: PfkB family carbohydrate kinase [Acidimicrobiales bacterium]